MKKAKRYELVKFPSQVIGNALNVFSKCLPEDDGPQHVLREVHVGEAEWTLDTDAEFFEGYRDTRDALYSYTSKKRNELDVYFDAYHSTKIMVRLPNRADIESVFQVFESAVDSSRLPPSERKAIITIFIGHGRNPQWKDLKDHLHEKHGYKIEAYETGARAGFSITDVLSQITSHANLALLVHTGEDGDDLGRLHARENVIHETGLFQGALSPSRAIVLREEGCAEFSNLSGVQEIRFSKGAIKETFGEVLATIKREFGT